MASVLLHHRLLLPVITEDGRDPVFSFLVVVWVVRHFVSGLRAVRLLESISLHRVYLLVCRLKLQIAQAKKRSVKPDRIFTNLFLLASKGFWGFGVGVVQIALRNVVQRIRQA